MSEQAKTMTKEQMKIEKRRQIIAQLKYDLFMLWHASYWRFLHLTKLARPYSKFACRMNLYRKFPDGRCQWCGQVH